MAVLSQNVLIDRLNDYLKSTASSLNLKYGYCHGLSLLWLYQMATGREDWFYQTINKILALPPQTNALDPDIEKFIAHIEWLQNPDKYSNEVNQLDMEKTLELPERVSLSYLFNQNQLRVALKQIVQNNLMISISGLNHTVGVFKRADNEYHFFDANFEDENVKIVHSLAELQQLIIASLYKNAQLDRYPIEINMSAIHKQNCLPHHLYNIAATDLLYDAPGCQRMTNLYLACENGDDKEVSYLLNLGANPNQVSYKGNLPLSMAVDGNYQKIVAALLKHGADPLHPTHFNQTPFHYAVTQHNWQSVGIMLCHIRDVNKISYPDKLSLLKNRNTIMQYINAYLPNLQPAQQNQVTTRMQEMFTKSRTSSFFKPVPKRIVLHHTSSNSHLNSLC